jgi:hypothetical protein
MQVFAIRHKPTQAWMPARMFKVFGSGWSHWTPGPQGAALGLHGYDKNPRIFFTLQSARNALTAWLSGAWESATVSDGDFETGYRQIDSGPAPMKPEAPRKREDMEIVTLELIGA